MKFKVGVLWKWVRTPVCAKWYQMEPSATQPELNSAKCHHTGLYLSLALLGTVRTFEAVPWHGDGWEMGDGWWMVDGWIDGLREDGRPPGKVDCTYLCRGVALGET